MTARPHRSARRPVARSREIRLPPAPPALIRRGLLATTALLPVALLMPAAALAQAPNAAPSGGQVSAGSATISQTATTTTINQASNRAAIDWQRFDVGRNQTVQFNQPSAQSWTLNRVNTPDPSLIAGRIQANGGVAIVNQSGVVFTPGAQVNVGSLIASAAGITNQNFMAGRMVFDQAARSGARVENHGTITVADRGLASLVAPGVANSGLIRARLGRVALAGAETFTLDLAGDGLVSLDVTQSVRQAPEGSVALVTNSGTIEAPGGSVLLTADAARGVVDTLLRNTGRISADAEAGTAAGQVTLRGGANGAVEVASGSVSAAGTAVGVRGGTVSATSNGDAVRVGAAARLDASGAGGGTVRVGDAATARTTVAGEAAARGTGARVRGGLVTVEAKETVAVLDGAKLDASGTGGGGTVLVGTTGIGRDQTMAERTTVQAGAAVHADATEAGDGGTIAINSTASTDSQGVLSARGGPQGGDGGFIEVSGQGSELTLGGDIRLDAPAGAGGTLLIDPNIINVVGSGGTNLPGSGIIVFADSGTGTINVKASSINSFTAGTNILLQANNKINVNATVNRTTAGSLFLETGSSGEINVNADMTVSNGAIGFRTSALNLDNVTVSASTNITVSADSISTKNGVTFSAPTLSLRADTFSLTDNNALSGSTLVEIGPRLTTKAPFIPANGVTITTALLRLGRTTAGDRVFGSNDPAVNPGAPTDDVEVTANNLTLTSAITRSGTNMELFGTDIVRLQATVNLGSGPTGGTLALNTTASDSRVQQDAGATITTRRLSGSTGTGSFSVAEATNALGSLGDITTTGNISIRSTGDLSVSGAVSAGAAQVAQISTAGALSIAASGSVTAGTAGGTGQVNLFGNAVSLAGPVTASVVTLAASADPDAFAAGGGAVTQSGAGTVSAGTLSVLAGSDVTLTLAGNSIAAVTAEVPSTGAGTIAIRSGQAMTVTATPADVPNPDGTPATTPTAGIGTAGDVRLAAPALTVNAPLVASGAATRSVTLIADALTFAPAGLIQPGAAGTPGTVTFTRLTNGAIDLGGAGGIVGALEITSAELGQIDFASRLRVGGGFDTASLAPSGAGGSTLTVTAPIDTSALGIAVVGIGTLDLRGSTVSQDPAAAVTTTRLESTAGAGGLQLTDSGNAIAAIGDVTVGGDSTIRVDAGLVLDGTIDAGANTLNLRTDGTVTQTGGSVAGGLDVRGGTAATSGAITLERQNALTGFAANAGGNISVRSEGSGTLSIGAVKSPGDIRLFANNAGTGAFSVDGAVDSTGAGTVRIETTAPLSVSATGSVTSGSLAGADAGAVHLWGQSIALAGAVEGGAQVSLSARGGAIDTSAGATTPATITQSGAGIVSTRRLALAAVGDATLGLDNQVDSVGATGSAGITLRSTRDLAIASGLSIPTADDLGSLSTGTGVRSTGGSVALSGPTVAIDNPVQSDTGDIAVTAFGPAGSITLAGGSLTATAASRTITLTGDTVDLGLVTAVTANTTSGTIVIQPFTNGANLKINASSGLGLVSANTLSLRSLGSGGAPVAGAVEISGNLALSNVNVLDLQGASVRQLSGTLKVTKLSGNATGGDFNVNLSGNNITALGGIGAAAPTGPSAETGAVRVSSDAGLTAGGVVSAADSVAISSGFNIQLNAAVTAGSDITLSAGTGIAQGAGGVLTANGGTGALSATASGGSVLLTAANNQIGAVSGSAVGLLTSDFALRSVSALTVNSVGAVRGVDITGAGLTVAGTVDGVLGNVALTASSGNLVVNNAVTSSSGTVGLTATAGEVQLFAAVTAATDIALTGQAGVSQSNLGVLSANGGAGALTADAAGGSVALNLANNRVGSVTGSANSDFRFRSTTGLSVGLVSAGGTVGISGPALTVAGPVTATTGNIGLTATTGDVDINGGVTATAGNVALTSNAAAVQIDAPVTAGGGITLSAATDIAQTAPGVLSANAGAGALGATASSGAVALTAADNRIGSVSGSGSSGFALRSIDPLSVGATSSVFGTVDITGPSLTVTGTVHDDSNDITLTALTGGITVNGVVETAPGVVTLSATAGGIQINNTVNGGNGVVLLAQNDITQTAPGVITALGFTGGVSATSSAGAVALTAADNAMGGISGSAATGFAYRNTVAMNAGPITASGGDVLLIAPTLSTGALVHAQANTAGVTLVADALSLGANTISAGSAGQPGRVVITRQSAGGTLAIGGTNAAGVTAVAGAGIQRADTLQVGGDFNSGSMTVSGNGDHAITLAGPHDLTGRVATLDLRGTSITQTGGSLTVNEITATATSGDILIQQPGNAISVLGAISAANGAARIVSGSPLTVNGPVAARDVVALTGQTLTISGTLNVTTGDLALTATGGDLAIGTAVSAAAGNVSLAATTGSLLINAPVTAGLGIDLSAGVAISQTAPGVLSTNGGVGALTANATGGAVTLTAADNLMGSVAGSSGGDFVVRSTTGLTVGAVTAGGGVAITGPALTVSGPVAANGGNAALTAASGDIAVNGSIGASGAVGLTASAGAIQLDAGVTAGTGITFSALNDVAQGAGGLLIASAGNLSATSASGQVALAVANNRIGAVDGSASGDFALRSVTGLAANAITAGGALSLSGAAITANGPLVANGGDVRLNALTTNIQLTGAVTASADIRLTADGDIGQGAGGILIANAGTGLVLANAAIGGVDLTAADNQAGTVRGSSGGDFAFRSVTGLTIGQVDAGGGVAITGPTLNVASPVTANGGGITLTATTGNLVVGNTLGATGDISLTASLTGIQIDATATAGGNIVLSAGSGIGQSAPGVLSANGGTGSLTATAAGGAVTLTAADNLLGSVGGSASGDFTLRSITGLAVNAVTAGGAVDITGPVLTVSGAVAANGGGILLTTSSGSLLVGNTLDASATIGLTSAGGIQLDAGVTAGTDITLAAQTGIAQGAGGVLIANGGGGSLLADAVTAALSLTSADNQVGTVAGSAGTDFSFRSVTGLTVGAVTAGGAVDITGPALTITGPVAANGGGAAFNALGGDVAVDGAVSASGALGFTAGSGGIVFNAPATAGTTVTLLARNDIGQTAPGTITANGGAGLLTVNALTGRVALGLANSAVGQLTGSAANGFAFRNGTALTIGSITSSGGDIIIDTLGGPMLLTGPIDSAGGIAITSGGSMTLPGTSVIARGGNAALRSAGDLTATNVTASSPGTLTLAADGAGAMLRLSGGSYTADYLVLSAGPAGDGTAIASFSNVDFFIGTAMLVAAGGGIGLDTDLVSIVTPQDTGALPLIFFDTRQTTTALRALNPAVFAPNTRDDPLRQPNDQIWQVFNPRRGLPANARIVGVADGSGPATSGPAGNIIINLEAPGQPVFFLLDGGTAIGTIVAGRLGVHGQPSSQRLAGDLVVDLTGQLAGINGSAAARFGRVATTNPADQGRYRFDNCVLDTINCVVPSLAQPVVLPLSNRIDIRSDAPRLDPDVLLPNIAEEDY